MKDDSFIIIAYNPILRVSMGSTLSNRINPNSHSKTNSLLNYDTAPNICRKNFRFIRKMFTSGEDEQSVIWLAENWENSQEKFFIKAMSKQLIFKHRRVQSVMNELKIFKNKGRNNYFMEPLFAFQDLSTLYLVMEYCESVTLEEVLQEHVFSQQEAKYIMTALASVIECVHQQKLVITQLHPRNIIIRKDNGRMKILEFTSPLEIDTFYPSSMVNPLNPYCAPQILAMDQVLAESDYYSLGLILYYIMKNKPPISEEIWENRLAILKERISVVKSDLPEGWKPNSVDFLVKLLIKNPQLRLGRYGSFEISNHSWLQNYSWSINNDFQGLSLSEDYFVKQYKPIKCMEKSNQPHKTCELHKSYQFQKIFNDYEHYASRETKSQSYDSIQQQY